MKVVPADPFHPVLGLLIPQLTQRMLTYSQQVFPELSSLMIVKDFMSMLWGQDPSTLLLAYVDDQGKTVGHCAARILTTEDGTKLVTILQCQADGNVGDAIGLTMRLLDQWGKSCGAKAVSLITTRSEKEWQKREGFKEYRKILIRDFGPGDEVVDARREG